MTLSAGRFGATARDATRQLRRDPGFAAVLALTIGIGIAAATAIFTVARGVLLRPLPYDHPDGLISIQDAKGGTGAGGGIASANLPRYRAARALAGVTAFSYTELVLSDGDTPERVIGAAIDPDFHRVVGVGTAVGRDIDSSDAGPVPAHVAVLSDALWRRRYRRDSAVVGRSIPIDGEAYTVIGVTTPSFEFPRNPAMNRDAEIWIPRGRPSPMAERRGMRNLTAIARLRAGGSIADAQKELDAIAALAATENPGINDGWRTTAVPLREAMVGAVGPAILALASCAAALLLISWVNAAAAALARLSRRRASFEVRLALGGGPRQITELVVGETLVASALALVIALPASALLRRFLLDLAPVALPRQAGIALDGEALAFAVSLALLSAGVIGLGSAWWLRRLDGTRVITSPTRTVAGTVGRARAVGAFVAVQIALGTVLLGATSRMYVTYAKLHRVDPGFSADDITTATIALPGMRYRDARARSLLTGQLLQKVRALPGIEHAAVTSLLPLSGGLMSAGYQVDASPADSTSSAALRAVSADFFTTFGIGVRGRGIVDTDTDGAPLVAVVNAAFVRQSLGGVSPIGQFVRVRAPGADSVRAFAIVGVAADTRERDLVSASMPIIYFSDQQASFPHTVLAVKARGIAPVAVIRGALRELDATLALDDVASLASRVRSTYGMQIFVLALLATFAASGATLIAVGVYASVSFAVAADIRSIAVRIALGAPPASMLAAVIGRVLLSGAIGTMLGLGVVFIAPRMFALDPILGGGYPATLVGAGAILLVAAISAAVPARRASAADPATVLRA